MRKNLPAQPSTEHLKSQAKDLLDAYRRGEHEAFERFRTSLPAVTGADDVRLVSMKLALHDAQSVIAREYGFPSWNDLRTHVEQRGYAEPTAKTVLALIQRHMATPLPSEVQQALSAATREADSRPIDIEQPLPIVPIRNAMVTVGAVAPLAIARPSSIAAIEAARVGGRALAMFAQQRVESDSPSETDLHPIGSAVRLVSVVQTGDRGLWIVVRALRWIRLDAIEEVGTYRVARVSDFTIREDDDEEVRSLHRALGERVQAFIATLANAEGMFKMIQGMTALQLADATIANLRCSVEDKARYAAQSNLTDRLRLALSLMDASPA